MTHVVPLARGSLFLKLANIVLVLIIFSSETVYCLAGCWMLAWVMQKAIGEYPCVSLRRENIVWYYCLSTVSCMCWCEEENHPCDLSTNYRLSVDQLSTNYRPSILVAIDQLSTKCRPTIDPNWDIHTQGTLNVCVADTCLSHLEDSAQVLRPCIVLQI